MKTSLVALDGSPTSRFVLERAESLAQVFGVKLLLFRVIETGAGSHDLANAIESRLARAEAMDYLRIVANGLKSRGAEVAIDVGIGDPATEILRVAEANGVDLVVLGPNRGGVSTSVLGGTALKVAARVGTSLLLVRPGDTAKASPAATCIVAGVDGSPSGDWAAFHAAGLAKAQGAELVLSHVSVDVDLTGGPATGSTSDLAAALASANRTAAWEHLERLRRQLQQPGLRIKSEVTKGRNAAEGLREAAEKHHADLTVVGSVGWSADATRGHGSTPNALLMSGDSTVLVCRHALRTKSHDALDRRVLTRPGRLSYARAR